MMTDERLGYLIRLLRQPLGDGCHNDAVTLTPGHLVTWSQTRLAPLLYHRLRDQALLPPETEAAWREQYLLTAQTNLLLLDALETALERLNDAGVETIALKGASLLRSVYDNIAIRPLRDLDLLVRHGAVPAALDALAGLGYRQTKAEQRPGIALRHRNVIPLYGAGQPSVILELHWSPFPSTYHRSRIPLDWFWETALPLAVGSQQAWMLGPEAQLLHLCSHLVLHHNGADLMWWNDVAEVIEQYREQIRWSELLAHARSYDLLIPLQRVLLQLADQWQVAMPDSFLQQLAAARSSPAEKKAFGRFTARRDSPARALWAQFAGLPRWRQRFDFALAYLLPSWPYMRQRYAIRHPLLLPFYYGYRWWLGIRSLLHIHKS